jgi:hypothetical protein
MSILTRLSNIFTKEVDAYAFEKIAYASVTDYVHGDGIVLKTIYVPSYDMYAHYYSNTEEFIPYKLNEPFDENNKDYTNVRKIKISTTFLANLCDWYELREENKKWCDQNKSYFDNITK